LTLTACRGPIAGYVKVVEQRLEELERALSFVLTQEEVRKVFSGPHVSFLLHASVCNLIPQYSPHLTIPPHDTLSEMSREDRLVWFDKHALHTINDLLRYPTSSEPREAASLDSDNLRSRRSTADTDGCADAGMMNEAGSAGGLEQNVGTMKWSPDWNFGPDHENPPDSSSRSIPQYWTHPPPQMERSAWMASQTRDTTYDPLTPSNRPTDETPMVQPLGLLPPTFSTGHTHLPRLGEHQTADVPPAPIDRSDDLFW
jgi:hypothetical protein